MPSLSSRVLKKTAVGENQSVQLALRQVVEGVSGQSRSTPDELLQQARLEAEEIKKQAFDEGWQQGYRDGIEQSRTEAGEIRDRARGVLREAEETRYRTLEKLESEVRGVAVVIAEKLVARQLDLDPETIVAVAREALEVVRERESVVLYAHPADVVHLQEAVQELRAQLLPEGAVLRIIGDAELETGGCLVETEQGLVDATREVRWREVLKALV